MPISLSEKPGITITNALRSWLYLLFRTKNLYMTHDIQICYGICQSVDEGISETANMKKILETSNDRGCNFALST